MLFGEFNRYSAEVMKPRANSLYSHSYLTEKKIPKIEYMKVKEGINWDENWLIA